MKKVIFTIITLTTALLLISAEVTAQRGYARRASRSERNYNPATVTTVKGVVTKVETLTRGGVHFTLKTDKETIDVHLGPATFVNRLTSIQKGDTVTVVGSRIKFDQYFVIIAKSVKKGNKIFKLRNNDGTPLWAGRGRGRGKGRGWR